MVPLGSEQGMRGMAAAEPRRMEPVGDVTLYARIHHGSWRGVLDRFSPAFRRGRVDAWAGRARNSTQLNYRVRNLFLGYIGSVRRFGRPCEFQSGPPPVRCFSLEWQLKRTNVRVTRAQQQSTAEHSRAQRSKHSACKRCVQRGCCGKDLGVSTTLRVEE